MPPSDTSTADGAAAPADERVGTVLSDRYRLDSLLGEGGMGKVYAAEHVLMRKRLAVKILHRELTSVPEVVARFEREAMAAANIDHPNVAAATDFGKLPDGSVFLVLEFVQGRNLRDEIAQGPMPIERALAITRQIASALASAHGLQIVHRDLKPENVMLVQKGNDPDFVKVLDFGIARVPIGEQSGGKDGKPITKVGMVFGTPEYMAPEQALGQAVDGRADLYAVGVMLFEMIAGVRPFSSKSPVGILGQQLSKSAPTVADRVPGLFVPPAVEHLLAKFLQREAGERFQAASDAVAALDALLGAAPGSGPRLFTMAAGSPAGAPIDTRVSSIPDLEHPVPLLAPPDLSAVGRAASQPDFRMPSSPEQALASAPSHVAISGTDGDPFEADLHSPSSPSLPRAPYSDPGRISIASIEQEQDRARAAWRDLVERSKAALSKAEAWVDTRREQLPPNLREPLRKVPAPAILVAGVVIVLGAAFGLGVMVVAVASSGGDKKLPVASASASGSGAAPSGSAATPSTPGGASTEQIAKAREGGSTALSELALLHPKDARVLLALMRVQVQEKKHADAVATLGKALDLDPRNNDSPEVASALWTCAQAKDSMEPAFTLLEGPMGARGADIAYELAHTEGVRPHVKQRADKWLKTEAFQKAASPALGVLVLLRQATTCKQRHALLARAKNVGDDRVLALLETFQKRSGCGKRGDDDCNPCLRTDSALADAIGEIQARAKKK